MVELTRPTPGSGTIPSKATLLFIGWIRNTSSQLTGGVVAQLAPGPAIFQTLPKPVVPSPVQRFPRRSNATPLAPGTPVANGIAVSGFRAFGARTHMIPPLAASAMLRLPAASNVMPAGLHPRFGMEPTTTKLSGLSLLILQTGQGSGAVARPVV